VQEALCWGWIDGQARPLDEVYWLLAGADEGKLWCGTIPGGLSHSTDHGASWQHVESLWHHPDRAKWFGGCADWPGIRNILVDPRDRRRLLLGVSCAGVRESGDKGATWANIGEGLRAEFMPSDQEGHPGIQDPYGIA